MGSSSNCAGNDAGNGVENSTGNGVCVKGNRLRSGHSGDSAVPYKIIIDTNALLMPFQFSINLDCELDRLFGFWKILVPECVLIELRGLSKDMLKARAALKLAANYPSIPTKKKGDQGVLEALVRENGILLSNDRHLRNNALKMGYRVIFLRSRSHLEVSMKI